MSLTASETLALKTLPEQLQVRAKRAIDGSVKDLELLNYNNQEAHVLILLPIFYVHLDVSRIPAKVEPDVVPVILRAKWSFFAIINIGAISDTQTPARDMDIRARHYMLSKSDILVPWLPFFYHNFLSPSADSRSLLSNQTITKLEAIQIIRQTLMAPASNHRAAQHMIRSIPGVKDALAQEPHTIMQLQTFRLTMLGALGNSTVDTSPLGEPSMIPFFVDHLGGTASCATLLLSYIRKVTTEGANIDMSQPLKTLRVQVLLLSADFESTTKLLLSFSKQDAVLREALISMGSVRVVATGVSLLWPRLLFELPDKQVARTLRHHDDPFTLNRRRAALQNGYGYILHAMTHASDNISAICQALIARILQSILQTGLLPGEEIASYSRIENNSLEIIRVLLHNYMFDRALTTMGKAVDKVISGSREVEDRAKCDKDLWKHWMMLKNSVQIYTGIQEKTKDNVTYGKHCGGPSCPQLGNIASLHRCSGCAVARYCSKQCQKRDWKTRHQYVCKPLRLSVGPSHSEDIVRSLALLAGIELVHWGKENTQQILAHTRKTRPDCNWLVIEFDMTVLPVAVSVRPMSEYLPAFGNNPLWKELAEQFPKMYQGPTEVKVLKLRLGDETHILLSPHTTLESCATPAEASRSSYGSH